MASALLPLHGGSSGPIDMLVGIGPVLLGCVLIGCFVMLLGFDKRNGTAKAGWRDETPSAARLLFSGTYYQLEELLRATREDGHPDGPEVARLEPAAAVAAPAGPPSATGPDEPTAG